MSPLRPFPSQLAASAFLLATLIPAALQGSAPRRRAWPRGYHEADASGRGRFRDKERPHKLVVVAGSIGAYRGESYPRLLASRCTQLEVLNLAKTGLGVRALSARFRRFDKRLWRRQRSYDRWLLFGGGLNSIANVAATRRTLNGLFAHAHARGYRVAALSPTPWGSLRDPRFRGDSGARYLAATAATAAHILNPPETLRPEMRADLRVDLLNSPLRAQATEALPTPWLAQRLRRLPEMRRKLRRRSAEARQQALSEAVEAHFERSKAFMASQYRAFDHIHPNNAGHALIFAELCPALPESWQCDCRIPDKTSKASH